MSCIFCKIINGEIPCKKVYQRMLEEYNQLDSSYEELQREFEKLDEKYTELKDEYDDLEYEFKELEKNGIMPDLIVGTSMGALVGGMYASGKTVGELELLASKFNSLGSFSLISTLFKDNFLNS